jgi:YfiR/HmsC-like
MDAAHRIYRNVTAGAAAVCLLAISSLLNPSYGDDSFSEDAVKAAYLYRFAGYVEWPNPPSDAPFVIDVLGSPAIARELQRLLPHHSIKNRAVQVREIHSVRELGNAQIVYVAAGHAQALRTLTPAPGLSPVLLVSDEEGGLSAGSELNFLTINRNVRFEVSLTAADRWGLKISSELLGVAIRVLGSGRQSEPGSHT